MQSGALAGLEILIVAESRRYKFVASIPPHAFAAPAVAVALRSHETDCAARCCRAEEETKKASAETLA